jgi:hypothetical protein
MVRLYYKMRYNEDKGVFEVYDPHHGDVIGVGEQLCYLKVKVNDVWEFHPCIEEDLIHLISNDVVICVFYDPKTSTYESLSEKLVITFNGEEYLKNKITGRFKS